MALPYRIIIDYGYNAFDVHKGNYIKQGSKCLLNCNLLDVFVSPRQNEKGEYIKPYLRPMSSMTEEEDEERIQLGIWRSSQTKGYEVTRIDPDTSECYNSQAFQNALKFLLKNHFDIFGLIPKGLAIEVTEENNPYK